VGISAYCERGRVFKGTRRDRLFGFLGEEERERRVRVNGGFSLKGVKERTL